MVNNCWITIAYRSSIVVTPSQKVICNEGSKNIYLVKCSTYELIDSFPIENNIMILTDTTFEKAISKYENIFAVFYAPWCSYCKKLLPELEKTASILSKENIIVAKIDSTKETKISNKYKIISYPT